MSYPPLPQLKNRIAHSLDEQLSNRSCNHKMDTIESLVFQQQEPYLINDQGVSNRRRLFSFIEENNFFSQSKSISHEFQPIEGTDRLIDKISDKNSNSSKELSYIKDEETCKTKQIIDSSFQIDKQEDTQKSYEQKQFPFSQNLISSSQMIKTREKITSDMRRKSYQDSNISLFKYSKHLGKNLSDQNSFDTEDNIPKFAGRQKLNMNRRDTLFHNFNNNREPRDAMNQSEFQNNIWHYGSHKNHLISLSYMKKFVKQLLLRVAYKDYRILQKKHLELIDDKSIIDQQYIEKMHRFNSKQDDTLDIIHRRNNIIHCEREDKQGKLFNLKKKLYNFFYNTFYIFWTRSKALEPSALVITLWEIFFLMLLIGQLILIPIKGCFSQINLNSVYWGQILYKLPIFCYLIDIFIGFHTGYYEFGMPIMDKRRIAMNYINHKFWIDFCCTVLLSFNLIIGSTIIDLIAMFLRINQMKIKVDKIDQHFRLSYRYSLFTSIMKLIFLVVFLAHLCGCGFHLVGQYTDSITVITSPSKGNANSYRSWIQQQGLEDKGWIDRYISSLYFSIISMITIGYGDITPINTYEKIYVIGMTFISCGTFAYCINTIGNIFAQRDQKQKDFQQNQYQLLSYLDYMQTPQDTQIRVLKYFEYQNEQSDEAIIKGAQIFDDCSTDLKEEVVCNRNMKLIQSIPLFRKNFSKEFLKDFVLKMQEKRFGPGESIISNNQIPCFLTIITKGEVEYYFQNTQQKRSLSVVESKVLALRNFLTETPVPLALRAKNVVTVIQVSFSQFTDCLKNFQSDYEKFCMIRDQIIFDNRYIQACYSCNQYGHEIQNCPQIHFQVQSIQFAKKVFYSSNQEKKSFWDRRKKGNNTLTNQVHVSLSLKMKRWEVIRSYYPDYFNLNVSEELQVVEKDKYFFKRCPKIKQQMLRDSQLNQQMAQQYGLTQQVSIQNQPVPNQIATYYDLSNQLIESNTLTCSSDESQSLTDSSYDQSIEHQHKGKIRVSSLNDIYSPISKRINNSQNQFDQAEQINSNTKQDDDKQPQQQHNQLQQQQYNQQQQQGQNNQVILNQIKQILLSQFKKTIDAKQAKYNHDASNLLQEQKFNLVQTQINNSGNIKSSNNNEYILSFPQHQEMLVQDNHIQNQQSQQFLSIVNIHESVRDSQITKKNQNDYIGGKLGNSIEIQHMLDDQLTNEISMSSFKKILDYCVQNITYNISSQTHNSIKIQDENNQEDQKENKLIKKQNLPIKRMSSKSKNYQNDLESQRRRSSQKKNNDKIIPFPNQNQFMQAYRNLLKQSQKSLSSINESKSQNSGAKQGSKDHESQANRNINGEKMSSRNIDNKRINYNYFFGQIGLKFEMMKEYQNYYPKNNLSNVIKGYKKVIQKLQMQMKGYKAQGILERKQLITKYKQSAFQHNQKDNFNI